MQKTAEGLPPEVDVIRVWDSRQLRAILGAM
jgi:hypothetical protein